MSGNFSLKRPMRAGSTYSPGMVLAATWRSPASRPWKLSMAWRVSRWSWSMRVACDRSSCPARVASAPRPRRSRSRTPSSCSSVRMCSEMVGWVSRSACAALEKDLSSATFTKISSCLRSMVRSIGACPRGVYRWANKGRSDNKGPRRALGTSDRTRRINGSRSHLRRSTRRHPTGSERRPPSRPCSGCRPRTGDASRALARTRGTHHRGLGTLDILLELPLALIATVLVDRHLGSLGDPTATGRLAGRSSSRTPRRSPRGYRRFHPGGCPDPP